MTPFHIDACIIPWPDGLAFTALGFLFVPGLKNPVQLLWIGGTPWKALRGMFAQAKAMSVATAASRN